MKLPFTLTTTGIFFLLLSFRITPAGYFVHAQKSPGCFPEIPGWIKNDNIRYYTPLNLYDYINGAAEFYLNYDFRELYVAEYNNNNHSSFRVEIYLHETPLAAYGIYSQERPLKGNYLQIGTQGYIELPVLNFITGNSYVKIYSYDTDNEDIVLAFAREIAAWLGGHTPLPAVLACFPAAYKTENSERFVNRYFLGYDFLHSGFIADYITGDNSFQLFIIQASDSGDCLDMLNNFFKSNQESHFELKGNNCIINDQYHGTIELEWDSKYIWGTINLEDKDLRSKYIQQIKQGIEQKNNIEEQEYGNMLREEEIEINGVIIEMVFIPPGTFSMGSPEGEQGRQDNESPQHEVVINNGFWMGKYEVTQGQWKVIMGGNEAFFQEGDDYPVEWVSWDMVQEFIQKLNEKSGLRFRLPSEAEWEYACRAGTTTPFYFGKSLTSDQANFNGKYPYGEVSESIYREKTMPVGRFMPNAWGLYDMHGNVWEWCEDVYRADIYANQESYSRNSSGNPVYIEQGSYRIFRGGGWIGNGVVCRSASRGAERQMYSFNYNGFRLVLDE